MVLSLEALPIPQNHKISAVIVAFNAERFIADCLKSICWVHEVIVIDLGSRDATISICERYGATVIAHDWVAYADPVRDLGACSASSDWILHLDPDERVPDGLRDFLQHFVAVSQSDAYGVVKIPRKNIAFGRWVKYGGYWPDWQIRFGRKDSIRFSGKIHQTGASANGAEHQLPPDEKIALVHHSIPDISTILERLSRYAHSQAQEYHEQGQRFSVGKLLTDQILRFYKGFIENQGYRDGTVGLVLAFLWEIFYPAMIQMYLWEIENHPGADLPDQKPQSSIALFRRLSKLSEVRKVVVYILRKELRDFRLRFSRKAKLKQDFDGR